jgi:hypothetical protein
MTSRGFVFVVVIAALFHAAVMFGSFIVSWSLPVGSEPAVILRKLGDALTYPLSFLPPDAYESVMELSIALNSLIWGFFLATAARWLLNRISGRRVAA